MDNLSKPELLTLLSIMEGELEARDLVIEALRVSPNTLSILVFVCAVSYSKLEEFLLNNVHSNLEFDGFINSQVQLNKQMSQVSHQVCFSQCWRQLNKKLARLPLSCRVGAVVSY